MNLNEELEKRMKFLDFLELNGLNSNDDKRVIEVAPDVNQSISKLLVEKYDELFNAFIISPKFSYDNIYRLRGFRGDVKYFYSKLIFNLSRTEIEDKILASNESILPKETSFDSLIIYGLRRKMFDLGACKIERRFLGEIYKGCPQDLKINDFYYSALMYYLNFKYYNEFQFIEEYDSNKDETYVLIRRNNFV